MLHKLSSGKGYNCQSLIFAKRKKVVAKLCGDDAKDLKKVDEAKQNESERKMFEKTSKYSAKVYTDQLRLFNIAFWDVKS